MLSGLQINLQIRVQIEGRARHFFFLRPLREECIKTQIFLYIPAFIINEINLKHHSYDWSSPALE